MKRKAFFRFMQSVLLGLSCVMSVAIASVGDLPVVGSQISGRIELDFDQGSKVIPLPAGNWKVLYADENKGTFHRDLSPPDRFAVLILVQVEGSTLVNQLYIRTNITSQTKQYSDQLCDRNAAHFLLDSFDSAVYDQRCLKASFLVGYLANPQGVWADVRSRLVKAEVSFPNTIFQTRYTEFDHTGQWLDVQLYLNPVAFGFPDNQTAWGQAPWHKDFLIHDAVRTGFVNDWVSFSMSYGQLLHDGFVNGRQLLLPTFTFTSDGSLRSGTVSLVPAFKPRATSLPDQGYGVASATTNRPTVDYESQCASIGFKSGSTAWDQCVKELKSRDKK